MTQDSVSVPVLIATHHKTGTVWLRSWFARWAEMTGRSFRDLSQIDDYLSMARQAAVGGTVLFHDHARFRPDLLAGARGIRMVRDPRDVVISAASYHVRSSEPWLRCAEERFGGRSYQETLSAISDDRDRLIFEMDHVSGDTIREMARFLDARFMTVKYEEVFLSFPSRDAVASMSVWLNLSAFEEDCLYEAFISTHLKSLEVPGPHVSSGEPFQWQGVFDSGLEMEFMTRFSRELAAIGYR